MTGMVEWCPLHQPGHGHAAGGAGAGGFRLPALLVRLAVGLPSLPLRPAARKRQEKGELRPAVTGLRA